MAGALSLVGFALGAFIGTRVGPLLLPDGDGVAVRADVRARSARCWLVRRWPPGSRASARALRRVLSLAPGAGTLDRALGAALMACVGPRAGVGGRRRRAPDRRARASCGATSSGRVILARLNDGAAVARPAQRARALRSVPAHLRRRHRCAPPDRRRSRATRTCARAGGLGREGARVRRAASASRAPAGSRRPAWWSRTPTWSPARMTRACSSRGAGSGRRGPGRALRPAQRRRRSCASRVCGAPPLRLATSTRVRAPARRSSASRSTGRSGCAPRASGRRARVLTKTRTGWARSAARSSPCAASCSPATPAARSSTAPAGWSPRCSPRRRAGPAAATASRTPTVRRALSRAAGPVSTGACAR